MALTKVTGQVINNTTGLVVGVTTVGGGISATDGFFSGIVTAVGDASFSGNVSVGGTLTYEDVTNIDAVGIITARSDVLVGSGITLSPDGDVFFTGIATGEGSGLTALNASNIASGTVPTARLGSGTASSSTFLRGDSTFQTVNTDLVSDTSPQLGGNLDVNTKNINFGDSASSSDDRLNFGAGTDLSIYHDGTNNRIENFNASAQLRFLSDNFYFINKDDNEAYAKFLHDGAVELYHDNSKKFETTSGGVNVTGVVSFSTGHTYKTVGYDPDLSPIQGDRNTWFYTRFDQSASVSGSTIVNLATGPLKISDTLPVSNLTRQSFGGSTAMYHASSTSGSVSTNFSAADPFAPKTYGLTMGCLFYAIEEGSSGAGIIHYGNGANDEHFYLRFKYNYNSEGHGFSIGQDNDGSDAWYDAMPASDLANNTWYYLAMRQSQNGALDFSINGNPFYTIRTAGTVVKPTDAVFGLSGDPYADNDSKHRYATAFWYRGLLSDQQIRDEYEWARTIWTGASLP